MIPFDCYSTNFKQGDGRLTQGVPILDGCFTTFSHRRSHKMLTEYCSFALRLPWHRLEVRYITFGALGHRIGFRESNGFQRSIDVVPCFPIVVVKIRQLQNWGLYRVFGSNTGQTSSLIATEWDVTPKYDSCNYSSLDARVFFELVTSVSPLNPIDLWLRCSI